MKLARPRTETRSGRWPVRGLTVGGGLAACLLLVACAVVEAPPGGPVDLTPPRLAAAFPESGSVAVGPVRTFRLSFSEKMTRQPAEGWLHFYPAQRIRSTSWKGAQVAEVELFEPLPADTVVVVEVTASLQDAHKVKSRGSRRYPLATGAALPGGRLAGALVMGDSAVTNGVLELFAVPPDTVEYFQQPLLRRTVTDEAGHWSFDWLPAPGGPWLVRAFSDNDANLRAGDREAQRVVPDTLRLSAEKPAIEVGVLTLYSHGTPGLLRVPAFDRSGWPGTWAAWPLAVTENDTGWTPGVQPAGPRDRRASPLVPEAETLVADVPSGAVRVVVFADVNGDSLLGDVTGDLLRALATAAGWPDTLRAASYLEPWWLVEGLQVPPGLAAALRMPAQPPTFTARAVPDSAHTTGTAPDSTATPKE